MNTFLHVMKLAAVLVAAIMLGNWFLSEIRSARAHQKPWYRPYLSLPGIAILLIAIVLPVAIWYWRPE
ncbi:MAG: hypothetical protein JJV98_10095 [Desulfosarcina sp.]|nr:hypothetical protein [Desulfobacterales bacterium]